MSFRKYELGSYEEMCAAHRWEVPERYNIARDVCDKHEPRPARDGLGGLARATSGGSASASSRTLSNRFANVLEAIGVERGDRVATLLPSLPETAAVFIGTYKRGAILLSLSVLYGDDGIQHRLTRLGRDGGGHRRGEPPPHPRRPGREGARDGRRGRQTATSTSTRRWSARATTTRSSTRGRRPGAALLLVGHHRARPRASSTPTATCSRTRSSSSATTCATASSSTARASGPGPPGSARCSGPWRYGAVALVQARKGGYDPEEHLRFLSKHGVENMFTTPTALRAMTGRERTPASATRSSACA